MPESTPEKQPMTEGLPDVLTLQEVAEFLKVNPKTVRGQIEEGKIVAFKVGKVIRIQREKLEEFLQKSKQAVEESEPKSY